MAVIHMIAGRVPVEFLLFALTLAGVALFHRRTLEIAAGGVLAIVAWKLMVGGFAEGPGFDGLWAHLAHEWVILANLFALLVGFALLAQHFEDSHLPARLPALLPDDWTGGLVLLAIVFVLSSFLDNIAAAMIGGTIAGSVFRGKVHIGYLAAIVGASNAGGSGSVIGDTTTTMMWLDGIAASEVLHAYVAAVAAFCVFAVPAARQQHRHSPIVKSASDAPSIDWPRLVIVGAMLAAAIATNLALSLLAPAAAGGFPFLGAAVWVALLACAPWRRPRWDLVPDAARGSVFLLSLVLAASMMPVDRLPDPSWQTALGLGFASAVFDNIPLTKLALEAGGFDWGFLAYAVGFGGSMIWFGSSAGVALSSRFPEARSAIAWIKGGWHVALAYVIGFAVMLALLGWHPPAGRP
jgi:Na+/H+ antiporter NhaD/arsenite permease-like protein